MSINSFFNNFTNGFMFGALQSGFGFSCFNGFGNWFSGGFCGFGGGFNSLFNFNCFNSMMFTPTFTQNLSSTSIWDSTNIFSNTSYNTPSLDFSSVWNNANNYSSFWDKTATITEAKGVNEGAVKTEPEEKINEAEIYSKTSSDKYFDKMLNHVLSLEGGIANLKGDSGGLTNKGITTATYDTYRKKKGLSKRSVREMTDAEMKDIYYNDYYKASGADKIKNPKLALYVFETAVNMGVGTAKSILKASGGNLTKFEQIRLNKYNSIANNNPEKRRFLKNWQNRVSSTKTYAQNNLPNSNEALA